MALSAKAKKEILKMNMRAKFPYLIEITDNDDSTVYRYANADTEIVYNGHTYEPCTFSIKPPEKSESKIGNGTLNLSGVDQSWIQKIRNADSRFSLSFIALIIYNQSGNTWETEVIDSNNFTLTSSSWGDDGNISWTFVFDERQDVNVPYDTFSSVIAPALV